MGCTFVAQFMTAAHTLVLVWQARDDPEPCCGMRSGEGSRTEPPRHLRTSQFSAPVTSYYAWEAAGRPVHGVRGKPTPSSNEKFLRHLQNAMVGVAGG